MAHEILTAQRLRELLHYDPDLGWFMRAVATGHQGCHAAGSIAGRLRIDGYIDIGIDDVRYLAHRLAWLWKTGAWPVAQIDHMDGVRDNNAWANLRNADQSMNSQNLRRAQSNNQCGFLGVWWDKRRKKWIPDITTRGKKTYLGQFDAPELAHAAYVSAKRDLHPGGML